MKLLVVDHNALEPAKRKLYDKIVALGGIDLRLVVPSQWFNGFSMLHVESKLHSPTYELLSSDVLLATRTHRMIYSSLPKHLREFQPDVFYMHAEPENFAAFEGALLKLPSTKLVFYTARNLDHYNIGYPYKFSRLHKWIEKFVLHRASHGIACNSSAQQLFSSHGFSRVSVIPLAVDTELFCPAKTLKQEGGFVVGYVGRLERAKGVDLILHALKELQENCTALIVGSGPMKEELMKLSEELGIATRIRFLGAMSPLHLPEVFSQMDVVVLPSKTTSQWKEQFGRVLIEAMACGVPVIGSTSGEIPNVIGDAGLIFKEASVEGLRLGFDRLSTNELLRNELREAGLHRVRRLFSIEVVSKQYHDLLLSL